MATAALYPGARIPAMPPAYRRAVGVPAFSQGAAIVGAGSEQSPITFSRLAAIGLFSRWRKPPGTCGSFGRAPRLGRLHGFISPEFICEKVIAHSLTRCTRKGLNR